MPPAGRGCGAPALYTPGGGITATEDLVCARQPCHAEDTRKKHTLDDRQHPAGCRLGTSRKRQAQAPDGFTCPCLRPPASPSRRPGGCACGVGIVSDHKRETAARRKETR